MCAHAGQAQPTAPNPRVMMSNQPIVTLTTMYVIAGCPFTTASPQPCVTGQFITAATRVTAGGQPVLLQDSQSICAPNGTPLNIVVTQTRAQGT
mgnify:CR=1 FL=1